MSNVNTFLRWYLLLFLIGLLVTCVLAGHAAPAPPNAEALLKRSDTFRNGWPSFVVHVKITDYESGKPDEQHLYDVSQKGADKTYVEFMSPREKGEHLLMLGDDMWVYLPDVSRPVRITPLERLSGDASNGDVARTNYAADYAPIYLRTEKAGTVECYVLELTARRKGATYQRILLLGAHRGCAPGEGRVLPDLWQAHQDRYVRRVRPDWRPDAAAQAHAL